MKNLARVVIISEDEKDVTLSGETGHWVNVRGRPIFIGEPSQASKRLSTLDPSSMDRGRQILTVKVPDPKAPGGFRETKKYVYSDKWNQATQRYKFAIANDIEKNRDKVEESLEKEILGGKTGAPLAVCALVISRTGMRVGQPGNATTNDEGVSEETYGATTLERSHVKVDGDKVTFAFKGKAGVDQNIVITDKVIAKGVNDILSQPGKDDDILFTKKDPDNAKKRAGLRREDVSDRFKRFNDHYKPKDFRTAKAMQEAVAVAQDILGRGHDIPKQKAKQKAYAKAIVKEMGEKISKVLGNQPGVAISNYTNPLLVEYVLKTIGISKEMLESLDSAEGRAASTAGTPESVPLLISIYGEDAVKLWFSSLSDAMNGKDNAGIDLETGMPVEDKPKGKKKDKEVAESAPNGSDPISEAMLETDVPMAGFQTSTLHFDPTLAKALHYTPTSSDMLGLERALAKEGKHIYGSLAKRRDGNWSFFYESSSGSEYGTYVAIYPHKVDLGMYIFEETFFNVMKDRMKISRMGENRQGIIIQVNGYR